MPVDTSTPIFIGFDAMCMGWSWALHLCQVSITSPAEQCVGGASQLLVDKAVAPVLVQCQTVQSVSVDNFTTIAVQRSDMLRSG